MPQVKNQVLELKKKAVHLARSIRVLLKKSRLNVWTRIISCLAYFNSNFRLLDYMYVFVIYLLLQLLRVIGTGNAFKLV